MLELRDYVFSIAKSHEEYRKFPKAEGAYE